MCLSIDVLGTSPARHAPFQARGSRQLMAKRMAIGTRPEQWSGDASPIEVGATANLEGICSTSPPVSHAGKDNCLMRGITTLDSKCNKNLCNNLE